MGCENCKLLSRTLVEILLVNGVVRKGGMYTGPDIINIAEEYIKHRNSLNTNVKKIPSPNKQMDAIALIKRWKGAIEDNSTQGNIFEDTILFLAKIAQQHH